MATVAKKLKAIADVIRAYVFKDNPLTLDDMCFEIDNVYNNGYILGESDGYWDGYESGVDAGYTEGKNDGKIIGIEQGKKDAYDEFWDDFQKNGTRTMYNFSFGCGWNADNFKPKYPMKPTRAYMMFYNNEDDVIIIPDFVEFCDNLAAEQGKTSQTHSDLFVDGHYQLLDFSECITANGALARIHTKHHGVLDFSKCTNTGALFYSHNWAPGRTIQKIDKFISSPTTAFTTTTFQYAVSLTDITMDGVVANSINFGTCPLTGASIRSVISVLSDDVSGQTATFKKTAKEAAFTEDEWEALIAPKRAKGWNFVLA